MKVKQGYMWWLLCVSAAGLLGCEVTVAIAQGKDCPDERSTSDGRCCPEGTRTGGANGMTCIATKSAKAKPGSKGKAKLKAEDVPQELKAEDAPQERGPRACTKGKERNEDTGGQCCYAGQVWAGGKCVGLLAASVCPSGYKLSSDKQDCEEAECEGGRKKLGVGQCCWEGQAWSKVSGKCVGVPQCPANYKVRGEDCRRPIPAPAGYALIPAGRFVMGSPSSEEGRDGDEGPEHQVEISQSFYLKKTEVTQGEWSALMGSNPSNCDSGCSSDLPVNEVSWYDGLEYLNKLSEREGLEKCYEKEGEVWRWTKGLDCEGYRYPTEAEWEYAARGGTTGARYGSVESIAWHHGNSGGKTKPVGKKVANRYGLYDMLGNVWEWTWDEYGSYSSSAQKDPIGGGLQQSGSAARVARGGGWGYDAQGCRAAFRRRSSPGLRYGFLGLRPARSSH